ncbi:IS30 family transposase [Thioalbus denitrificans]|uniref:IS30 family transposase n=1 Tax=Thioalbus denitrificans TaxID=547122 RepID=A0A369BK42_9GAMM|nr:IS30 family transposase [Thioalbus denitrificans]RCX21959.1 IS30 family transposase [Thioalbus denitrificans]
MRGYTQLAQEERYQIYALMKAGHSQAEIAALLQRHKSTISRELRRNRGLRGYRPQQAQRLALERRAAKVTPRLGPELWNHVERLLREDWSPEQISLWLAQERTLLVSHEWIYRYILQDKHRGGDLHRHLRCQKPRRKRYGAYERRGRLSNQVSIDERPAIVARRGRIGDWEADTIIGKNHSGAIVSLTERKSRLALIAKVPSKAAEGVQQAILSLLAPLADRVHTLTSDNGKEFALHEQIAQALEAGFYFAHPYASWERGLNENTNGLIRQYFPKDRDFSTLTDEEIQGAMDKLNNRPRKCLGMKTPNQVFFGINPPVALVS